jgi:hypothetical protein
MTYTLEQIADIVKDYNCQRGTEALILMTAKETSKEVTEENTQRGVKLNFAMSGDRELIHRGLVAAFKDNPTILKTFKMAIIDALLEEAFKESLSTQSTESGEENSGLST